MQVGYNLTWDGFSEHLKNVFNDLNTSKTFTDVTLVCDDDEILKAHRFILSSCSDVFKTMFADNHSSQSCVYLRGIHHKEMDLILKYMYFGEATFENELLEKFLSVAKDLKVKDISHDVGNIGFDKTLKIEEQENLTFEDNKGESVNVSNESLPLNKEDTLFANDLSTRTDALPLTNNDLPWWYNPKDPRKPRARCPECKKICGSKTKMISHYRNKHEGIRWPCSQCEYKAPVKYALNRHIKIEHQSSMIFRCDDCKYETKYKERLTAHTNKHRSFTS